MENEQLKQKGKYVSRAAFAKMQAEKQRLEKDIYLMVVGGVMGGTVWQKWRKHFKIQYDIQQILRDAAEKTSIPFNRNQFGTE